MKKLIVLLVCLSQISFAQEAQNLDSTNELDVSKEIPKKEKNYAIDLFYEIPSSEFLISVGEGRSDISQRDLRVQYQPSATSNVGIRLEAFGFDASFKTEVFADDSDHVEKYGKSQFRDIRLNYQFSEFGLRTHYLKYKGFYADLNSLSGTTIQGGQQSLEADDSEEALEEDIIIREDIESVNYGFEAYYRKDLSMGKDFGLDYNAFILILGANINYTNFSLYGNTPFIPEERQGNFGRYATLTEFSFQRIGLDVEFETGFAFSKKSSFTMGIIVGPGLYYSESIYQGFSETDIESAAHINFQLGYNFKGDTHRFKTFADIDVWEANIGDVNLDVMALIFTAQYGIRF